MVTEHVIPVEVPSASVTSASPDVLIVGGGPAGLSLARSLALHHRRVLLLERDLSPSGPDRIVGELLQPGGCNALRSLGLQGAFEDIGAVRCAGYCILNGAREVVVPYPRGEEGRSFHHGRFVAKLREEVRGTDGVEMVEATVRDVLACPHTGRVLGVSAVPKCSSSSPSDASDPPTPRYYFADLTIIADGSFSKFRHLLPRSPAPLTRSHFVGLILHGRHILPSPEHGTVVFVPQQGPVLMYGVSPDETRILIDVKGALPSASTGALAAHIRTRVLPHLPEKVRPCLAEALETQRLRSMPNSWLPPALQATRSAREGVFLVGDAYNMRHPLTGGGMTVAFSDSLLLGPLLARTPSLPSLSDWPLVSSRLHTFHYTRKPLAGTINVLSMALYDLFGADDPDLAALREACFDYFLLGGSRVSGPVSLLAGLAPRPALLVYHFFAVALYAVWEVLSGRAGAGGEGREGAKGEGGKTGKEGGGEAWGLRAVWRALRLLWVAALVFLPLMWTEIKM